MDALSCYLFTSYNRRSVAGRRLTTSDSSCPRSVTLCVFVCACSLSWSLWLIISKLSFFFRLKVILCFVFSWICIIYYFSKRIYTFFFFYFTLYSAQGPSRVGRWTRKPNVSPFPSRHLVPTVSQPVQIVLSGGIQHRALPCYEGEEIKIYSIFSSGNTHNLSPLHLTVLKCLL